MSANERTARGWIPAAVGCYWTRGPYHASTVTSGDGTRSGYALYRDRHQLAAFVTWEEIERLADRRKPKPREVPE